MGITAGALGLGDLLAGGAAVAPEVAAAAAPAAIDTAGAIALPEIAVTAAAPEAAAATAGGLTGADVAAGLGAGSLLGITPALAGGLSPSSVVSGEFGALPGGGVGPATPISAVPGFGPGGAPVPTPAPAAAKAPGVGGVGGTGAGGSQASEHDLSASYADPSAGADTALAGYEGNVATPANPNQGGVFGSPAPATGAATPASGGVGGFFKNNAGLLALLGAGLGGELLAPTIANKLGLTNVPQQGALTNIANTAGGTATQQANIGAGLEQPLTTDTLPTSFQAQVDQALADANATTKGKYAVLGLSGSTMEQSALADNAQNSQIVKANLEQQLFTSGTQAMNIATQNLQLQDQVYTALMDAQVQQDDQLQASIGQFASALGLGSAIAASKTA